MKLLNIYAPAIKEFEEDGVINVSESGGSLFWIDNNLKDIVKDFEEKYNATVYHVILNHTEFGRLYSMLYVSQHEVEWDYDKDDIKHNYILAYVKNIDDNFCSEFGSIGIKSQFGGVARVS